MIIMLMTIMIVVLLLLLLFYCCNFIVIMKYASQKDMTLNISRSYCLADKIASQPHHQCRSTNCHRFPPVILIMTEGKLSATFTPNFTKYWGSELLRRCCILVECSVTEIVSCYAASVL
jgi:hypothetical protein